MFYFRSIIIIVPAYILPEVIGVDRSSRLFRLVLGPSSVEILLTLVRVSENITSNARWENSVWGFKKTYARLLPAKKIWDNDVVISRWRILYWHPGFQEESLVKVSLMSNNSDTSKIHFVVVFVDMTGDLRFMIEHRESPFVFRNPGFQWSFTLTVVYKPAVQWWKWFCTLCQTLSVLAFCTWTFISGWVPLLVARQSLSLALVEL